jgi:hypothetical protein
MASSTNQIPLPKGAVTTTEDNEDVKRMKAQIGNPGEQNMHFIMNEKGVKSLIAKDAIPHTTTVFFKNCDGGEYTVSAKCTKVFIESCHNCTITLRGTILTHTVEIWKCNDTKLNVNTTVRTLQADLCHRLKLHYLARDFFESVVWSGVYDMLVGFEDDAETLLTGFSHMKESYPDLNDQIDQFIIRTLKGKLTNEQIVRLANGYPTTEREAQEFDAKKEKNDAALEEYVQRRLLEGGIVLGKKKKDGPKVGRNDKCPCNSGKKYKQCCEKKDQEAK